MTRLCERPGCSSPAAVAYGMESDHLLVWLEIVPDGAPPTRVGMLCRRHADAMVVPRGWTLDDRRETRPRLFRVSETVAPPRQRNVRAPKVPAAESQAQLSFDTPVEVDPVDSLADDGLADDSLADDSLADEVTVGEIRPIGDLDPDETRAMPWRFEYDESDDLDGALQTSSPLLSRAFRGVNRSRPS